MKQRFSILVILVLSICVFSDVAAIAQGSSSNYRIDESFIGPGGSLESNSTNFKTAPGQQGLGGNAGGSGASNNFRTEAGGVTTDDPSLACTVNTSSLNFGSLSSSTTATATATFSVLNYTSYGYVVQIIGDPPTDGAHTLAAMSSNAASATSTEQFGLNVVDNTSPNIGANPEQVPDNTFSFGAAMTNYDTPDSFRYVPGETIARSTESSGQTNYTISYIANISNSTPQGSYGGSQTLLCTGTY